VALLLRPIQLKHTLDRFLFRPALLEPAVQADHFQPKTERSFSLPISSSFGPASLTPASVNSTPGGYGLSFAPFRLPFFELEA
jgi:hypothetical protein